jgi:hypothetical protein
MIPMIILGIPALYWVHRFLHFWYRVITVDVTEAREVFAANPGRFVLGIYGHTSFLDGVFYISAAMKMGNGMCMANADYKWMYPWFTRKYVHFIVPGGATTQMDGPQVICVCVEGTRKFMPRLKRGYYYLAKNTGRKICFCIVDYKENAFRMSRVCEVVVGEAVEGVEAAAAAEHQSIDSTLDPLRDLVRDINVADYAQYPASVGPIVIGGVL